MPILFAQVTIPAAVELASGDSFQNGFHIDHPGTVSLVDYEDLVTACVRLYNEPFTSPTLEAIAGRISDTASRTLPSTVKIYDLSDPAPRVPRHEDVFNLAAGMVTGRLPAEVAIVATQRGVVTPGFNRQRFKGRSYFGPLNNNASTGQANVPARPNADVRNAIGRGLVRFGLEVAAVAGSEHVVYSAGARDNSDPDVPYDQRPLLAPIASPIISIEVDDAFDTMRSRGLLPSVRQEFPVVA